MDFKLVHVLFAASLFCYCNGFLLQNSSSGTAMTDQHYFHVMELLAQEKENVQQMEKFILKLNNEMKSLQQQVSVSNPSNVFSHQMSNVINTTTVLTNSVADIQNENVVLQKELTQLKNDYSVLNKKNEMLKSAMHVCNNTTMKLKTELETFTHSIPAGNLNNITQIQSNVESLEHKLDKTAARLNVLTSSSNARNQDFLALLNQTRDTQHKITTLETEIKQNLQSYQSSTNDKISDISHSITSINQTVALTSCGGGSVSRGSVINTFTDTKAVYGISDIGAFINSGKFTCEFPGVYLFSVFIMSGSNPSVYGIYKNNELVSYVYIISGGGTYHTGTGIVAVSLDVGDTLYVKGFRSLAVYDGASCVTVIKIR